VRGGESAKGRRHAGAKVRSCAGAPLLVLALCASVVSYAQAPAFDVASVKPNKSGENRIGFGFPTGGLTATNMPLRALIIQAYKLHEYELLNLPDWAAEERYDVAAKTSNAQASGDERLAMLQTLLAERFQLRMHPEQREMAMYSLVFARDDRRLGPDIAPSTVDCVARSRNPQPPAPPAPGGAPPPLECGVSMGLMPSQIVLNAGGIAFSDLVRLLARNLGRPVVDKTGLTGTFNVKMRFQAEGGGLPGMPLPQSPAGASPESNAPSLMAAVQEQLGLKLESGRAQVPVQVVDSVDRPTED
jgi:uncharacterized protein (TIGR03435 family)